MLASLSDVSFGYAAELIFRNLSFQVNPRDRVGVVGPNGHGKSTLLRLIAGTLEPESGTRSVRRGVEIGYLRQSQEFPEDVTVHDLLMGTFPEVLECERKLLAAQKQLEEGDDSAATLERYGELQHRFEELDGYTLEARAAALASEVGFVEDDLKRQAGTLSGGERTRFELARVLLRAPELLLLDEPTNHLDLVQIERLERRLAEYPSSFLIVSHDRAFLRATCTGIVEVERQGATRYPGGYDAWKRLREERLRLALEAYVRQHEKVEKTEDFIRRNIAGQKTKQAQSRRRMLEKMEKLERPEDVWEAATHLGMEFEAGEHPGGREAIRARNITVGYAGAPPLVRDFDWTLHRGERVGVVGPNGAGKTTLARALLGRLRPLEGLVELGYAVRPGYLDQKLVRGLQRERSLVDEVRSIRPDLTIEGARDALARYRFLGEDVFKTVAALSGGERCRLALLKVSLTPHNLLVLDEPTNHLDIPACEVLERALAKYTGTLLVISHDREFLDAVVDRVLWVEDGTVRVFEGNYTEARRRMRAEGAEADAGEAGAGPAGSASEPAHDVAPPRGKKKAQQGSAKPETGNREESKRRRRELQQARNRVGRLEQDIVQFEQRLEELVRALREDHSGDWERLHALANEEQELRARLERRYREWERLSAVLDEDGRTSAT
jgi:ATP-binding cassette, subfamily F, member 3